MSKSLMVHINLLFVTLLRLSCANPIVDDGGSHGASLMGRSLPNQYKGGQSEANIFERQTCLSTDCGYCATVSSCVYCLYGSYCAVDGCCYSDATRPCNPTCISGYVCDYGTCVVDLTVTSSTSQYTSPTPYPYSSTSSSDGPDYTPHSNKKSSGSSGEVYKKAKLTSKAIGGIVGGVLAGLIALITAIGLWWRRKKTASKNLPSSAPVFIADQSGYPDDRKQPGINLSPISSRSPQPTPSQTIPFPQGLGSQPIPGSPPPLDLNGRPHFAPPASQNGVDNNIQPGAFQHHQFGQDGYISQRDVQFTPDHGIHYVPVQSELSGQSPPPNPAPPQFFAPTPQSPH